VDCGLGWHSQALRRAKTTGRQKARASCAVGLICNATAFTLSGMGKKTSSLNVRLEPKLKREAEKVLATLGLSSTAAVTLFYRQLALRGGLPFDVRIPNAVTRAAMAELEAGGGKVHRGSAAQVIDDILAGGNDE
jgi:DNA-damage-inducible protein J